MVHENHVQFACEEWCSTVLCFGSIRRMVLEEFSFMDQCFLDRLSSVDIALTSVDDGNVTETEGNNTSCKDVNDICASIHQIDFGEHTNSTRPYTKLDENP